MAETSSVDKNVYKRDVSDSSEFIIFWKSAFCFYAFRSNWLPITTVTTASGGSYTYNWNVPTTVPSGQFTIQAVFAGDTTHLGSSATTTAYISLFAAPESAWGSLIALVACFAAAALFVKTKFRSNRRSEK